MALIVSLAVLVVLVMMATIFATLSTVERDISRNFVDDVRARMVAESGLHEGMTRLRRLVAQGREDGNGNGVLDPGEDLNRNGVLDPYVPWPHVTVWRYRGEDWNGSGTLDDPRERQADQNGVLDTLTCPADRALAPSLAETDAAGRPRLAYLDESGAVPRPVGVTHALAASAYGRNSDFYALKIVDASSQIYLNDANPNLRRILNNLGFHVLGLAATGGNGLGDRILNARRGIANRRFSSTYELLQRGALTSGEFERVKDFLTAHAWVDDKVVNPVPLSEEEHRNGPYLVKEGAGEEDYFRPPVAAGWRAGTRAYRYGPGWSYNYNDITGRMDQPMPRRLFHRLATTDSSGAADPSSRVYGVDELNPQWIEVASRAPVNLNAASKEVLMALLEGLEGFYCLERNRLLSGSNGYGPWAFMQHVFGDVGGGQTSRLYNVNGTLAAAPAALYGSELGILYRTGPILGPAGTSYGGARGTLARILAEKIIAFREGRNILPGVNGLPDVREGPFDSWAQFASFCDQLVLQDPDVIAAILEGSPYGWNPGWPEWHVHAQARMDVLKANFNPNLHLNELNPDAPLWTWVDKTDLITASTEFCFQPMGHFEITSVGRVVQPDPPGGDLFAPGARGRVVAEKVVVGSVVIYDAVRESTQSDFFGGDPADDTTLSGRTGGPATNNNRALQTGPEPENGEAPYDDEYEGYLTLSPHGGAGKAAGKRQVWTNLPQGPGSSTRLGARSTETVGGASDYGEWFHAHFDYDFNGHYQTTQDVRHTWWAISWFGERRVHYPRRFDRQSSNGVQWYNYPDPSETANPGDPADRRNIRGPYCLADRYDAILAPAYDALMGPSPSRKEYRCARSFRVQRPPPGRSGTPRAVPSKSSAATPVHHFAPSDLRTDGAYSERHAALLWASRNDAHQSHTPVNVYQGAASFWLKPNFFPELAGKIRCFFSLSRPHQGAPNVPRGWHWFNPTPFALYLTTRHNSQGLASYPGGDQSWAGINLRPRRAFLFGWGFESDSGYLPGIGGVCRPMVGGAVTGTLNEVNVPQYAPADSWLRSRQLTPLALRPIDAHQWAHVLLVWRMAGPSHVAWKIYVNGVDRAPAPSNVFLDPNPAPRAFPADPRRTRIGEGVFGGPYPPGGGSLAAQGYNSYEWLTPLPSAGPGSHGNNDLSISPIRLGEPTNLLPAARWGRNYTRNYAADATFDEFYLFGDADLGEAQGLNQLWRRGRFYRRNDAMYTSRNLDARCEGDRRRPPPPVGATSGTPGAFTTPRLQEVLGAAWTLWTRGYRPDLAPATGQPGLGLHRVYDAYPNRANPVARPAGVVLEIGAPDPANPAVVRWLGPAGPGSLLTDSRWAAPREDAAGNRNVRLADPTRLKYRARFPVTGLSPANSILLDSPILDDVTIFYSVGDIIQLHWVAM